MANKCLHPQSAISYSDKRYPLRYGSAACEECSICGAFRLTGRIRNLEEWRIGPLQKAIDDAEKRLEEEEC